MNRRKISKNKVTLSESSTSSVVRKCNVWSIDDLDEDQIDTSDIPEWTEENWTRAKLGNIHEPRQANK